MPAMRSNDLHDPHLPAETDIRGNRPLPSGYEEIIPYWADLCADTTATAQGRRRSILYSTQGSAPNRVFIVQYTDMHFWTPWEWNPIGTFQVQMYESGDIVFKYFDIRPKATAQGSMVTSGISSTSAGVTAVQFSYNEQKLFTGTAVKFSPEASSGDANCPFRQYNMSSGTIDDVSRFGNVGRLREPDAPAATTLVQPVGSVSAEYSNSGLRVTFVFSGPPAYTPTPSFYRVAVVNDPQWGM